MSRFDLEPGETVSGTRQDRASRHHAFHRAPSTPGGALPQLRDAGRRGDARSGEGHAVRPAPARGGNLPEDIPGFVLRTVARCLRRPVRLEHQPRRPDEHAAPRARSLLGRARPGVATLRRAQIVASDETGVRIEGSNAYHWVFRCADAVVHQAATTRGRGWWCAPSWPGIAPRFGFRIATLRNKGMRKRTRPASPISRPRRRLRHRGKRGLPALAPRTLVGQGFRPGG